VNTDLANNKWLIVLVGVRLVVFLPHNNLAVVMVLGLEMVGKEDGAFVETFKETGNIASNLRHLFCIHVEMSPGSIVIASAKLAELTTT
jgi:hypothetical protein